jgi:3D-(3,5/4)-trihydroxycyclohexane-1,2-dione acylhydrolase (decyclizing)
MGYEIAGGLGVKMAAPDREVYVMVGDGSWLMMSSEIVTSIQSRRKLIVFLIDNSRFLRRLVDYPSRLAPPDSEQSIAFAIRRTANDWRYLPVDLAASAEALGADVIRAKTTDDLKNALVQAKSFDRTVRNHDRN